MTQNNTLHPKRTRSTTLSNPQRLGTQQKLETDLRIFLTSQLGFKSTMPPMAARQAWRHSSKNHHQK